MTTLFRAYFCIQDALPNKFLEEDKAELETIYSGVLRTYYS